MALFLDENTSRTITQHLRDAGFFVVHVLEAGLGSAADDEIITFARRKKLTIVTHDKDFGNVIRFPIQKHYGVIMLRFRDQKSKNVLPYLLGFLAKPRNLKSRLVVLREDRFRIV